jgi:hypothetical protein
MTYCTSSLSVFPQNMQGGAATSVLLAVLLQLRFVRQDLAEFPDSIPIVILFNTH